MGNGRETGGANPERTILAQLVKIGEYALTRKRKLEDLVRWLQVPIAREDFITLLDASDKKNALRKAKKKVEVKKSVNALLNLIGTVELPVTVESFLVAERFIKDTKDSAPVKISCVGSNFESWFGKMLVVDRPGSTLASHTLTRNAYDREIMSALGGKAKCETTLAEIWQLMSLQGYGQPGALLADGKANIFYVRDGASVLRAVRVLWYGGGWFVFARELDCYGWSYGRRVFGRNS